MAAGRKISRGTGILTTIGATAPFIGLFSKYGALWIASSASRRRIQQISQLWRRASRRRCLQPRLASSQPFQP